MQAAGLLLAVLIGISLGLLGGGGSILAVPILVYALGMSVKPAIAVSLLVVGATSVVGSSRHWSNGNVDLSTAMLFGLVSMAGSYGGGRLATQVTEAFQLTLFAVVMLAAAISMLSRARTESEQNSRLRPALVVVAAAGAGVLTGIVGVGGGFLIVPALVLFGGLPIKRAVGTSLVVIAMNSASGFAAYAGEVRIEWLFTLLFTGFAVAGVFAGTAMTHYVSASQLRRSFAMFLIAGAAFVLVQA